MIIKCQKCQQEKDISLFAKAIREGRAKKGACSACLNARSKAWRNRNKELVSARKKAKYDIEYYRQKADDIKNGLRPPIKKRVNTYKADHFHKYYANNKEKVTSHQKVWEAIRKGQLVRPTKCEVCNYEGKIHGHHQDYNKPLSVNWLCVWCHRRIHQGLLDKEVLMVVE